jgi:hypothetical protein
MDDLLGKGFIILLGNFYGELEEIDLMGIWERVGGLVCGVR